MQGTTYFVRSTIESRFAADTGREQVLPVFGAEACVGLPGMAAFEIVGLEVSPEHAWVEPAHLGFGVGRRS